MIESFSGRRGRRVDGQNYSSIKQLSCHLDASDRQAHEAGEEEEEEEGEQVLDAEGHQASRQQVKDDAHLHDDDQSISVKHFCNSFSPKVKREHTIPPVDSVSDRSSKSTSQADDLSHQPHHHHQQQQQQQQQQQVDEEQCTWSDKSEQLVAAPCDTVCSECTSNSNTHCVLDTQIASTLYCSDSSDEVCSCCSSHDKSERYLASTFYFQPHDYEDSQDEGEEEGDEEQEEDDENGEDEGESYSEAVTWQVKHKLKRSANWLLRFFSR